jgi:hypothetical protein
MPAVYHRRNYERPAAPVDKSSIWSEVVKKHFEVKEDEILETVCRWLDDKSPPGAGTRRGRGRTLADTTKSTTNTTAFGEGHKAAELKAKGDTLAARLKAALQMFPSRAYPGYGMME